MLFDFCFVSVAVATLLHEPTPMQVVGASNTLVVSSGLGMSSDALQTACGLSDALLNVTSSASTGATSTSTSSQPLQAVSASSWEVLLDAFLEWFSVERNAMKHDNPLDPSEELGVQRHLAFNMIANSWTTTGCSCGERRTVQLHSYLHYNTSI